MGKIYKASTGVVRRKRVSKAKVSNSKSLSNAVRKAIKYSGESKYFYTNIGTSNVDWNGLIQNLTLVPQGTTDVTRIGDSLTPMSLEVRGHLVLNQAGRQYCMGRMLIFRWLQDTDDTSPTVTDVLDFVGSDQVVLSAIAHDKREDYNILYDSGPFLLTTIGASGYSDQIFNMKKTIKLAGKEIKFVGGGTNARNHIYAIFVSDVPAVNQPYCRFAFKLNYKD